MRTSNRLIEGFDYIADKPVKLPLNEVRRIIRNAVEAGGFRRVEHGETFLHDKTSKVIFEFYSNVNTLKD